MRVGDRVRVVAHWSSFVGMKGRVVSTSPHLMVRLDGDTYPLRIEEPSVVIDEPSEISLTGAE